MVADLEFTNSINFWGKPQSDDMDGIIQTRIGTLILCSIRPILWYELVFFPSGNSLGEERQVRVYQLKDLNRKPKTWSDVDLEPSIHKYKARTEILARMDAHRCDYCGKSEEDVEVHHVRKLSDIKDGKEQWQKLMIARRRKTLVL